MTTSDYPLTLDGINAMVRAEFSSSPIDCVELGPDFAVARLVINQEGLRPGAYISGPTQFGLADAALWYLTFVAIGRVEPMALTSELSIRFLRPAQGDVLYAKATLESRSKRSVVGSVFTWCDDRDHKRTTTGQGTYALPLTLA